MRLLLNDSSVLLNLLAADCLETIATEIGWRFAICAAVRDEAKKLRDPATGELVAVDLAPLISSGLLLVLELAGEEEQALYVEQSMVVDDGEAMSIAIAASRGLDLAMDDKQATNHTHRRFPTVKVWTTPEILKHWAEATSMPAGKMGKVISLIEARSRFFPAKANPLAAWWQAVKGSFTDS